jgi:phosphoribosylanthranilate isomerase
VNEGVRVKVCGLTRREDVEAAVEAGVDLLGLNFYSPSPRSIRPEQAADLVADLPPSVEVVAVCVRPEPSFAVELCRLLPRLRALQWHGDSPPLPEEMPLALIPAFPVRDTAGLDAVRTYLACCTRVAPRAVLVDAAVPGQHGGTGQTLPWELLAGVDLGVPLILAGGLTPDNVGEAIRIVRPQIVDVASGVECAPGVKDAGKIRAFIQAVRSAVL